MRREDLVETDVSSTIDNDDDENPGRNQKPKQNSGKRGVKSPLGDKSLSSGNIISFQAASSHTGSSALDVSIATSMSPPMQFSTADDIFQPHFRHYHVATEHSAVINSCCSLALQTMTAKPLYLVMTLCFLAAVLVPVCHPNQVTIRRCNGETVQYC